MRKEHVVWLLVGVGVYYLYLKFRLGVGGNPLQPTFPRAG